MGTRSKIVGFVVVLVAATLGAGWLLRAIPARPGRALQTAEKFVELLKAQDLPGAYQLTTRRGGVGSNLEEFQTVVRQQWPGGTSATIRRLAVGPFQSYGNRLRRWLRSQQVEMPELYVEFSVGGVPFKVSERYTKDGEWKVSYFQTHAG